ncbi:MAG TPA: diacylglycerol kinase family protein [Gemmatimonadaceae bacterium]|nr:diacylglycerol kinase family protein [Gemmatimonadaceae bacterium]
MRATIIHNPTAGRGEPPRRALVAWFEASGYAVRYFSTREPGYRRGLESETDILVAAGGDGTVAKVATHLERRDVPLVILPLGTANNIATSLGIGGAPHALVAALGSSERRWLDVATAAAPWGTSRFVESAGVGLFAALLAHAARASATRPPDRLPDDSREARVRAVLRAVRTHPARPCTVRADGEDLSGDYFLAVAMNIRRIGTVLELAPDADPGDGRLDLVLLGEEERPALAAYLEGLLSGGGRRFSLRPLRAREILVEWDVARGHLDDEPWPESGAVMTPATAMPRVSMSIADPPIEVIVVRY